MGVKYGGQIFFGQNPGEAQNHHLLSKRFETKGWFISKVKIYSHALKTYTITEV